MNRLLPAVLLSCAAASLSNPAWSFQGFDFFEQIEQSIECVRKPGTDYLTCSNKWTPAEETEEETTPEPVVEPIPEPEAPKTYFELVENAFPDVTQEYVFFTDSPVLRETTPAYTGVFNIDIDNDGVSEIIQTFVKRAQAQSSGEIESTTELETTQILAWDFQDSGFVNVTDQYFSDDTNMKASCWVSASADVNNDGQLDFFLSCSHEDGALRLAKDGIGVHDRPRAFISQFDGKYKMYTFGPEAWYGQVRTGIDEDGVPFVNAAGPVPDGVRPDGEYRYNIPDDQSDRYYYDHNTDEMVTVSSDKFPNFSNQPSLMISRYNDYTDLLIQNPAKGDMKEFARQNNWNWPSVSLQAYYLDEPYGKWQKTPMYQMASEPLADIQYVSWDNEVKTRSVFDLDGYIAFEGYLYPQCSLRLYPNQDKVALTPLHLKWIPSWTPDVTLINGFDSGEAQYLWVTRYYLMGVENGEIVNMGAVEIDGESPAWTGTDTLNGMTCSDINQDGYDDIIINIERMNLHRYEKFEDREGLIYEIGSQVKVLLNQQDGTFKRLNFSEEDDLYFKDLDTGYTYTTWTGDYDGDGIMDILTFPMSVGNYLGPNSFEMNFYKGTAKILEAQ